MNVPVRIYDKVNKRMLYPEEGIRNGIFLSLHGEAVQWQSGKFERLRNVIVMHRTPHTQADGKHVWEGDICDVGVETEFQSLMKARGVMVWDINIHKWNVLIKFPKNSMTAQYSDVAEITVLGDIYQHPELLKEPEEEQKTL